MRPEPLTLGQFIGASILPGLNLYLHLRRPRHQHAGPSPFVFTVANRPPPECLTVNAARGPARSRDQPASQSLPRVLAVAPVLSAPARVLDQVFPGWAATLGSS